MKNPGSRVLRKGLVVHMEVSGPEVRTRAAQELQMRAQEVGGQWGVEGQSE